MSGMGVFTVAVGALYLIYHIALFLALAIAAFFISFRLLAGVVATFPFFMLLAIVYVFTFLIGYAFEAQDLMNFIFKVVFYLGLIAYGLFAYYHCVLIAELSEAEFVYNIRKKSDIYGVISYYFLDFMNFSISLAVVYYASGYINAYLELGLFDDNYFQIWLAFGYACLSYVWRLYFHPVKSLSLNALNLARDWQQLRR